MSTYDFDPDPDDFGPEPEHVANPGRVDIKKPQAEGKGPAPCARFCEATAFRIEIAGWKRDQAENLQNQCKLVDQIDALTAERDALALGVDQWRVDFHELRIERDAISEGWNTANKLALQNALERDALELRIGAMIVERSNAFFKVIQERDALKDAARLALDALECSEAYVGCESWSPSMLREVQETIAALEAVL